MREYVIKINAKTLLKLLRCGICDKDELKFKEVFYSDGEVIYSEIRKDEELNVINLIVEG